MGLRDEKLLNEFFTEVYEGFEYWAEVKIEEIKKHNPRKELTREENKSLQKLIETKIGRQALKKLLVDCGHSNLFSTLTYIDGCTGIKPLEVVNAHTRLPIAEETLHEHFTSFDRDQK